MARRTMIVSHRGLSGDEPENTLEAFTASVARGVEAMEFDVRQTADGVVVLVHDGEVGGREVASITHAELKAMVPGLCTLDEVLEVVPSGCLLDVEIKEPGIEEKLLRVLAQKREPADFVVTSFRDEVILQVKALDPRVRVGLVLGPGRPRNGLAGRLSEVFPAGRLRRSAADFVVLHRLLLKSGVLRRISLRGHRAWVWTVNKPARLRRLLASPYVEAVVTDRPVEAKALRAEMERPV